MKCNICENEEFDIINSINTNSSSYKDGQGRQCGGTSVSNEQFLIVQNRKVGNTDVQFKNKVNIYACQNCGNLQIFTEKS